MRNHAFSLAIVIAIGLAASPAGQITVPSTAPPQTRAGGNITTKAPAGPVPRTRAKSMPSFLARWRIDGAAIAVADPPVGPLAGAATEAAATSGAARCGADQPIRPNRAVLRSAVSQGGAHGPGPAVVRTPTVDRGR